MSKTESSSTNEQVVLDRNGKPEPLRQGQIVTLVDRNGCRLGEVSINTLEPNLVLGTLAPTPAYAAHQPLFEEHTEDVNNQLFSQADRLEDEIAALGLRITSPDGQTLPDIHDVQIGGPYISFRIRS